MTGYGAFREDEPLPPDGPDDELNIDPDQPPVSKLQPGVVYIDSRVGSRELAPLFQKRHGLKVVIKLLESADVAFRCGHSEPSPFCPGDYGCVIGIERKTLSDAVGSLMKNRLGGRQIPLMLRDYTMAWVLFEGIWRCGGDDCIEIPMRGGWQPARVSLTYSQLEKWMLRYDVLGRGNLRRWRTGNMTESAAWIAACFGWWAKEWKKHSIGAVDKMPAPTKALLFRPNDFQKVAASLPGIGVKNMKKVTQHFSSVVEMVLASPKEWQRAGLGKKRAYEIYTMIRREWR